MDDLAQYSPRRRPREGADQVMTRFTSPLVFRLAPRVPLSRPSADRDAWRPRLG